MKTIKEVLTFCNDFSFYNQYSIERVIELNQIRDCKTNILSENDYRDEKLYLRVIGIIDDISITSTDKNLEDLVDEVNKLRVGLL